MAKPQRFGIIVLGMHRSGTSLVSSLLSGLGCNHGGEFVAAEDDNPRGYWEHADVVSAHELFLTSFGSSWNDPRAFPRGLFRSEQSQFARGLIREILWRDFRDLDRWVIKDPRLCRLLPLWDEPLHELEREIRFLHILRHPLSVAQSLAARDGMTLEAALLLWLRHNLEAEQYTRGKKRAWSTLEDLVGRPKKTLRQAVRRLDISIPLESHRIEQVIDDYLDEGLVHHAASPDAVRSLKKLYPWVWKAYKCFLRLGEEEDRKVTKRLKSVKREMSRADRLLARDNGPGGAPEESLTRLREDRSRDGMFPTFFRAFSDLQEATRNYLPAIDRRTQDLAQVLTAHGDVLKLLPKVDGCTEDLEALVRSFSPLIQELSKLEERDEGVRAAIESSGEGLLEALLANFATLRSESQSDISKVTETLTSLTTALDSALVVGKRSQQRLLGKALDFISRLEGKIATSNSENENLRADLGLVQAKLDAAYQENSRLESEVSCIRTSRSWRATKPLRVLAGVFRGAGR